MEGVLNQIERVSRRLEEIRSRELTVAEAAMVFDTEASEIRHAVNRGMLVTSSANRAGRHHRVLPADDVMQWMMVKPFGTKRVECQRSVAATLKDSGTWTTVGKHVVIRITSGPASVIPSYVVHLDEVLDHVSTRLGALDELGRQIDVPRDGDAVIRGTEIEVHRIAALLSGGAAIADVLRDFPPLDERQVQAAASYARAYPKQGRPYPTQSAKAALRAGRGGMRRAFAKAEE